MNWTAVIPFKGTAARKTRLADLFSTDQRRDFSQRMFDHVRDILTACDAIHEVALLSDAPAQGWAGAFIHDEGRGLNAELAALATARVTQRLLIIHADLPLVRAEDIEALTREADRATLAISPDRGGTGTNALALVDPAGFPFQFGIGSFARHIDAGQGRAAIVHRAGLSHDIDTPDDYRAACRVAPDEMKRLI